MHQVTCLAACRYSFEYGPVHFTVMSTEHEFTAGSQQYQWLAADLGSVDRAVTPWLVLVGHRPIYINAGGRSWHQQPLTSITIMTDAGVHCRKGSKRLCKPAPSTPIRLAAHCRVAAVPMPPLAGTDWHAHCRFTDFYCAQLILRLEASKSPPSCCRRHWRSCCMSTVWT